MRKISRRSLLPLIGTSLLVAASCGRSTASTASESAASAAPAAGSEEVEQPADLTGTLRVGAIPDQDPDKLGRLYGMLVEAMEQDLGIDVEYVPVSDYAAAVNLFRLGDLDLVWFGGLTGVQARIETPGAVVLAQRDIDQDFHSVFIANAAAGIPPIDSVAGLSALAGTRLTFGSETSTSGRLMPQYFLDQAGVGPDDFDGEPGFSGSHDTTVDLVASGTYEVGVLNEQVWRKRLEAATVDPESVVELFVTPGYHDYHWLLNPTVPDRVGASVAERITTFLTSLSTTDPEAAPILELFGATSFVPAGAEDYSEIESIGRELGLVTE